MKNITKIAATLVGVAALTQAVQATPIIGSLALSSSTVTLNSSSVTTASEVVNWGTVTASGSFNGVAVPTSASMASPWFFAGATPSALPINNFWTVGAYSFQLQSFTEFVSGPFLLFTFNGLVSDGGVNTATTFAGSGSLQDPNSGHTDAGYIFSGSLSFNSVPDGGSTALLLGAAMSGLTMIKRKFLA